MEINTRDGRPDDVPPELAQDVDALLGLGANYIDVGFNTDRMAAEVPFAHIDVDEALAEKVIHHLVNILNRLK